jgi:hypothetical protein
MQTINCPRRSSYDSSQYIGSLTSQDQEPEIFHSLILPGTPKNLFSSLVTASFPTALPVQIFWVMSRCYKTPQPISESYHHHDGDSSNCCNFLPSFQFHFLYAFQ